MSMDISASALNAFQTRQNVTANNIANMNTPGFSPDRVDMQEDANGGVRASVRQTSQPEPDAGSNPAMEAQTSGTDLTQEMVDMIATENAYDANAVTLAGQASLQGRLINEMV
jgi:flagellar basal-body rod protein FlgC